MTAVEHEVLVHLVGDRDQVVLHAQPRDELELLDREDLAGGVVRRVEEQHARVRRDGALERVGVERPVGRAQLHDASVRAGERDARGVRVVVRLEGDDVAPRLAQREQRRGDRLGRARGDQHLGVGVVLERPPLRLVGGDRVAELGDADAGWVLVVAGADRLDGGVEHLGGTVLVGEALAEVDRTGGDGQRRHLGEDRGAEALHALDEVRRIAHRPRAQPATKLSRTLRRGLSRLRSTSTTLCQVPSSGSPSCTGRTTVGATIAGSTWSAPCPGEPCAWR